MQELFNVQRFFGLGCWPDLHRWPRVHENVVNRNWDGDKRRPDQKIVRENETGEIRRRELRLSRTSVSAVGKHTDMTETTPSSHYPLPTTAKPAHISRRIHPLPPSELWGGDICGERLVGKQCAFQFAPRSLQRQTRLRSLPQGR